MSDIDNTENADRALTPVPARQAGVYQEEIGVAQLMAKSSLLPSHLHGNPGNCLAVLMLSRDWNMNPIAVGLKTSVIPKRGGGETLMFEGQLVNAVINKSKQLQGRLKFDLSGAAEKTSCTVTGRLKNETEDRQVQVGMPTIQNSPLWKGTQQEKEQQLCYLGARVWCRRHLPEVLLGVYTLEDDFAERDDEYSRRSDAVQSRVAALDAQKIEFAPSPVLAGTQSGVLELEDEFIAQPKKPDMVIIDEASPIPKEAWGRSITDSPEDRKPCEKCGGKGSIPFSEADPKTGEVTEGIEPCNACKS